ncbi:hypothetical protein ARMSODRAFT_964698 [Armillaria solidipes]|uniref:Uncharacterized protein n=1 Tax=Armillaria solidipes TaxID=1076256 RepID=A0A2H3B6T4_9AGAR|nr:hypothetical protein ARMSODRAFT_964698 [Armillaria solidipes]
MAISTVRATYSDDVSFVNQSSTSETIYSSSVRRLVASYIFFPLLSIPLIAFKLTAAYRYSMLCFGVLCPSRWVRLAPS